MLTIAALSAGYGTAPVLRDFSLELAPGRLAAVIGPNGCGKSTLLRCIAGLLAPLAGTVQIDGCATLDYEPRARARLVALLPQQFEGGNNLTAQAMVLLGRTPHLPPYGAPGAEDRAVVARCLQAVDAESLAARRVGQLSGGERQRIMIARALAQQPRVLLLDEPISNLDIRYQHEILGLLRRLATRENLAVMLVLHQINLAAAVADSMVLLGTDGRIRAVGAPGEVMTREHLEAVYGVPFVIAPHAHNKRPQAYSSWDFELDEHG